MLPTGMHCWRLMLESRRTLDFRWKMQLEVQSAAVVQWKLVITCGVGWEEVFKKRKMT